MKIQDMPSDYFPGIIAHRGNVKGANPSRENSPDYIGEALNSGYGVEIDAWFVNGQWGLGHDEPKYAIDPEYFFELNDWGKPQTEGAIWDPRNHPKIWIHLKNLDAVQEMKNINRTGALNRKKEAGDAFLAQGRRIADRLNFFWHQEDDLTITNHGHIWVHPKVALIPQDSGWVVPELEKNLRSGDIYYDYTNENWTRARWVCVDYADSVRKFYGDLINSRANAKKLRNGY